MGRVTNAFAKPRSIPLRCHRDFDTVGHDHPDIVIIKIAGTSEAFESPLLAPGVGTGSRRGPRRPIRHYQADADEGPMQL